ncbi:MAG: DNA-formamidopyrimidine glycosylase family protein [Actinomycetota bacterium]
MPEGDTIRRLAAEVRDQVGGRRVARSTFRHPRLATVDLAGRTLVDATSHGKHLFLHFDDGWSLHVHLLMDGRVRFGRGSVAGEVEDWRRRFELAFDEPDGGVRSMVGVDIPLLHRLRTDDTARLVDHLGPDLCGRFTTGDLDVAVARVAAAGDGPLGGALLDQRRVAGFGNIYAVEVPFICGVSPFQPTTDVVGLEHLVAVGAALIRTNAELGPQNTTGRRLERTEHWILDDKTRVCPRCGAALRRLTGEQTPWRRRTAWCPTCQAGGAPSGCNDAGGDAGQPVEVDLARARSLLSLHPARRLLRFGDDPEPSVEFVGPPDAVSPRRPTRGRRTGGYRR